MTGGFPRTAGVYFPGLSARGGAERLTLELALSLRPRYDSVLVFTDDYVDRRQLEADFGASTEGVEFIRLKVPRCAAFLRGELLRIVTLLSHAYQIKRRGVEFFVNTKYKSELPGLGSERNVYYVHFPHRLEKRARNHLHRLYMAITHWLIRALVNRGHLSFVGTYDQFWANSSFTASHVAARWGVLPLVVYPACAPVGSRSKRPLIAVVSRFQTPTSDAPHKSQEALIDAFAGLGELHSQGWALALVGASRFEDRQFVERLRHKSRGLPIEFFENVTRDEVRGVLAEASIYWHSQGLAGDAVREPESQEHFGISVVEAMSAGAIPLVYGNAGPAEIVAPVEGVKPWQSTRELREVSLRTARLSNKESEQMRRSAEARAADFSRAVFENRVNSLLEGLEG